MRISQTKNSAKPLWNLREESDGSVVLSVYGQISQSEIRKSIKRQKDNLLIDRVTRIIPMDSDGAASTSVYMGMTDRWDHLTNSLVSISVYGTKRLTIPLLRRVDGDVRCVNANVPMLDKVNGNLSLDNSKACSVKLVTGSVKAIGRSELQNLVAVGRSISLFGRHVCRSVKELRFVGDNLFINWKGSVSNTDYEEFAKDMSPDGAPHMNLGRMPAIRLGEEWLFRRESLSRVSERLEIDTFDSPQHGGLSL